MRERGTEGKGEPVHPPVPSSARGEEDPNETHPPSEETCESLRSIRVWEMVGFQDIPEDPGMDPLLRGLESRAESRHRLLLLRLSASEGFPPFVEVFGRKGSGREGWMDGASGGCTHQRNGIGSEGLLATHTPLPFVSEGPVCFFFLLLFCPFFSFLPSWDERRRRTPEEEEQEREILGREETHGRREEKQGGR